jgi:hypothetical protein
MDLGPLELYSYDHLRSWGFIWHRSAIFVGRHHEDSHDSYSVPDIGLRLLSGDPIRSVVDIPAETLTMDILLPNQSPRLFRRSLGEGRKPTRMTPSILRLSVWIRPATVPACPVVAGLFRLGTI